MKTIDEAAIEKDGEFDDSLSMSKAADLSATDNFIAGFKSGVEFAQRWIPVEEEEPNHYQLNGFEYMPYPVLAKKGDQIRLIKSYYHLVNFTHWRPIELL